MTQIVKFAHEIQGGDFLCSNDGGCFEVKSVNIENGNAHLILDGSFSITHHGKDFSVKIKSGKRVNVLA